MGRYDVKITLPSGMSGVFTLYEREDADFVYDALLEAARTRHMYLPELSEQTSAVIRSASSLEE